MEKDFNILIESIMDGRRERSVIYPMDFLLLGSILAVLSGAYNVAAIHDFFKRHFNEESPRSANTIRDFFKN